MQGISETLRCIPRGTYESTLVKLSSPNFRDYIEGTWGTALVVAPLPKTVSGINNAARSLRATSFRVPVKLDFDDISLSGGAGVLTPEFAFVSAPALSGVGDLARTLGQGAIANGGSQVVVAFSRDASESGKTLGVSSAGPALGPSHPPGSLQPKSPRWQFWQSNRRVQNFRARQALKRIDESDHDTVVALETSDGLVLEGRIVRREAKIIHLEEPDGKVRTVHLSELRALQSRAFPASVRGGSMVSFRRKDDGQSLWAEFVSEDATSVSVRIGERFRTFDKSNIDLSTSRIFIEPLERGSTVFVPRSGGFLQRAELGGPRPGGWSVEFKSRSGDPLMKYRSASEIMDMHAEYVKGFEHYYAHALRQLNPDVSVSQIQASTRFVPFFDRRYGYTDAERFAHAAAEYRLFAVETFERTAGITKEMRKAYLARLPEIMDEFPGLREITLIH